jgi:DNA-binding IclR family transcriptional regulator
MNEKILNKILEVLKRNPEGLTTTEVAKLSSINIMTTSKYLAVLEALKKIEYRKIGMAKLFKLKASK